MAIQLTVVEVLIAVFGTLFTGGILTVGLLRYYHDYIAPPTTDVVVRPRVGKVQGHIESADEGAVFRFYHKVTNRGDEDVILLGVSVLLGSLDGKSAGTDSLSNHLSYRIADSSLEINQHIAPGDTETLEVDCITSNLDILHQRSSGTFVVTWMFEASDTLVKGVFEEKVTIHAPEEPEGGRKTLGEDKTSFP